MLFWKQRSSKTVYPYFVLFPESFADSMKCNDSLRLNPFSASLIILVAEERHFAFMEPLSLDFTAILD
jgi:hypothetical protein